MATNTGNNARLDFRIPAELKQDIEQAAAQLGRTVSDFAVSTLVEAARNVLAQHEETQLTRRDRDQFLALLDETDTRPKAALRSAARRYRKHRG